MEKKAFVVALLVYTVEALAASLLMDWMNFGTVPLKTMLSYFQIIKILRALKTYAGLVSDGFLLSQILLNMFLNSNQKALPVSFYIGTTFIRVLPHAYDLYRARRRSHRFSHQQLNESYIYASPATDLYSFAWDVIIPFGGLLLAGIICLQHKFAHRFILPQKLSSLSESEYEVPTVTQV